ncbi:exopolyphosphatase [Aestuariivirga litoralis]|uniref:exopolyphosphatase n=1 Tax=Aestuariivirga litoralis TaxID=2650924 RepID=UPI0018C643A7|nr:exopolyphosphatase [Aestuariivirga litoralis]
MSWHSGFRTEPPKYRPVAVVDIGSNSVRLVVYDGLRRSPSPIFNEKVLCGLGKGVAITGRLNETAITRALQSLRRFRTLVQQIGVKQVFAVATAAAREAENGEEFIDKAEKALGAGIRVLTGKEEARFAALGVLAGTPEADGVAGDLGGGSLELIDIKDGKLLDGVTLPIGPLRLIDLSGANIDRAQTIVDEYLSKTPVLKKLKGRTFYAVGGAWRNLARVHMAQMDYPLHVLHHYQMDRKQARSISELMSHLTAASLKDVKDMSKARVDTLPYGAMILDRLMHFGEAKNVVISVYGVREGLLYSKLPRKKMSSDALLSSCWDFARRYARSPAHELELCDWTDQIFSKKGLAETEEQKRLRYAACLLADIGWRAHPDYRAERSLGMISQAAFVGIDHPGRVFLALTIFFRYDGEAMSEDMTRLLDDKHVERAHLLSSLFRLAYILSAAMPGLLPRIGIKIEAKALVLTLPEKLKDLMGERVEKRLSELAFEMGLTPKVAIK